MTDGSARAWGWVAHLMHGGTTPWSDWSAAGEPRGRRLPGAQQLELLRRLNGVGRTDQALAARVLAADPPRRTRSGLPLVDGPPVRDHGPRPVDPAQLRDQELVRLAAVLLADDLAHHPVPEQRRAWPRPWRIRYRLAGDPEHAAGLRCHLAARGRPEGGIGPLLVLGTDTGRMLVHAWKAQCFRHGSVSWHGWLRRRVERGPLPRAIDLPRLARAGTDDPLAQRVCVVTDPSRAARLLGVRRGPHLPPPPEAAAAIDLGRRVSSALRPLAPPEQRARLTAEVLRPALADVPGLPLLVPAEHRDWLHAEAERLHRQLSRARYPVVGDPALVLPVDRAGVEAPDPQETLVTAMRLLLAATLRGRSSEPEEEP